MDKKYSLEQTISSLLENKRYSSVKDILVTLNAVDIAAIFGELSEDALPLLFRLLPKELAADTFVEMELTRRIGDAGRRLHTARSRNDQVAVDLRLYLREEAGEICAGLGKLL